MYPTHYLTDPAAVSQFTESVHGLHGVLGDDFGLMIDFHRRPASARAALGYLAAIAASKLLFAEEPRHPGDTESLLYLKEHSPVPIASGERLIEPDEFETLLTRSPVDIIQPDLCHCGGLAEGRKIASGPRPSASELHPSTRPVR